MHRAWKLILPICAITVWASGCGGTEASNRRTEVEAGGTGGYGIQDETGGFGDRFTMPDGLGGSGGGGAGGGIPFTCDWTSCLSGHIRMGTCKQEQFVSCSPATSGVECVPPGQTCPTGAIIDGGLDVTQPEAPDAAPADAAAE